MGGWHLARSSLLLGLVQLALELVGIGFDSLLDRLFGARERLVELFFNARLTVEEWGKTESSTERRTLLPSILIEDLAQWRTLLASRGHRTANVDFVVPGDLAGAHHGVGESETGACHFGEEQAKTWRRRCFAPAVARAAEHPGLADIRGATPYALRRGGISLRLRKEDPQTVARECGTSVQMLNSHYAFAIEDLRHQEPRPADVEWREARAALLKRRVDEQARSADVRGEERSRGNKFREWFKVRGRGSNEP